MIKNFIRGTQKVGRNDKCPCGSGRKFKHCHGGVEHTLPVLLAKDKIEKQIIEQGKRHFEKHKAQELQRQKQQGLGRPIISMEHKGFRFIAVGNRLHYGKWKTFSDFLGNYIKDTLGGDWGNAEIAKPLVERHPLMQWYDKICRLQAAHTKESGILYSIPITGAVSAYNRLSYNLYLISHNGKDIQTKLIARLKNKDNFQGAFFETQVAAWLIKAGFELEFEDESDRKSKHCEFTATYITTGEKYSVEAKSCDVESANPSRPKVGRKLYDALEKTANHKRLIFINLNRPLHTKEVAEKMMDWAEGIISRSERVKMSDGTSAPPAYICITNMNEQYMLDTSALTMMVSFRGFKIPDFMGVEFPSLRDAARARERHWPMFQLLKSMEEHREIPQTFDGELPSEIFAADQPPRLQVGQLYAVPGPDGKEINAKLVQATVLNDKAWCILQDPTTNRSWIHTFDMTSNELADYAQHPDTYFGVYRPPSKKIETAMELFDFFMNSYRDMPEEKLRERLKNYPDQEGLRAMFQKELLELLAECETNNAIANGFSVKSSRIKKNRPQK